MNETAPGLVSHPWVRKISPKINQFFPSGWVKKYKAKDGSGLLFTVGQKYAQVWSGPISLYINGRTDVGFFVCWYVDG